MKALYDQVSADSSKLITRRYSTSFSLGISLLDKQLHSPIYAIYGFVRIADEIVDSFQGYDQSRLLAKLKTDCFEAIHDRISANPVLHAFQQVVNQYNIGHDLILQFLKSMEMDLEQCRHDQASYDEYILGSAEVVGLMCLCVFTEGDRQYYERLRPQAMKLGAAFQKVNFLRDVGADFGQLNRTYFPNVNLELFTESDKKAIELDIEQDFNEALDGIRNLPPNCRRGVFLAYQYYRQLFEKIKLAQACNIFTRRFRISNSRKLFLLCDTMLKYRMNWI